MKQMHMGMYYPVVTYLHQLDARVKVVAMVMVMILLFFSSHFFSYALIACFVLGLAVSAGLPLRLFGGIRMLRIFLVLMFLLSVFGVPGEMILFEWRGIYATVEGAHAGLILVVRVVLMLGLTTTLTLTTPPFLLTHALEFLLSPLKKGRLPVAEGVLMINLALRFVPTVMDESNRMINAQKARGASFESEGILKRAKGMIPVLIPLILSSFKRADDLAAAMEARCFKIGSKRTSFYDMKMVKKDYVALLCIFLFFVAVIGLDYFFFGSG